MAGRTYRIEADWDGEAKGWILTSPDVPGLIAGAQDIPEIVGALRAYIPALTEIGVEPEDKLQIRFATKGAILPAGHSKPEDMVVDLQQAA